MDVIFNFPPSYTVDAVSVKAARDMAGPLVTVTPFKSDNRKASDVGHIGIVIEGKPTAFYAIKVSKRTNRPVITRIGPATNGAADEEELVEADDAAEVDADE